MKVSLNAISDMRFGDWDDKTKHFLVGAAKSSANENNIEAFLNSSDYRDWNYINHASKNSVLHLDFDKKKVVDLNHKIEDINVSRAFEKESECPNCLKIIRIVAHNLRKRTVINTFSNSPKMKKFIESLKKRRID